VLTISTGHASVFVCAALHIRLPTIVIAAFIRSNTGLVANTMVIDWDTLQIIRQLSGMPPLLVIQAPEAEQPFLQ